MTDAPTKTYMGHTITLTPNWRFEVAGPEVNNTRFAYTTYDDATKAIDKAVELRAKTKAAKFNKIVLDSAGALITVIGFNRSDGDLKVIGAASVGRQVYPNVPWIAELLRQRVDLLRRTDAINNELRPFEIRNSGHSYRGMDADAYARSLAAFDKSVDEAESAATIHNVRIIA